MLKKEVKDVKTLFVDKLKVIKNVIKFFFLFIFYIFVYIFFSSGFYFWT